MRLSVTLKQGLSMLEAPALHFLGCLKSLRLEGGGGGTGGAPLVTLYWWSTRQLFLLTLYNSKIIGGI